MRVSSWFRPCLLLFFFYHHLSSLIHNKLDGELGEEIIEFQSILENGGLEDVIQYLAIEVESESEDTFFRLVSLADGQELAMEKNFSFSDTRPLAAFVEASKKSTANTFGTITLPDYPNKLRIVSGSIGQGFALQVGSSFTHDEKVLALFKQMMLLITFPLLLLSAVIGWFLARHALKDVEEVTLTAEKIAGGDYNQRVRLKQNAWEIQKLADTFNIMLDRIQALIKGIKEVTDNIAHDLRSPLTRIRGQAERAIVSNSDLPHFQDMAASTIEECDNLIDMINTMLDITEAEAGVERVELETIAVNDLIQSACDLFEPIAKEKNVTLTAVLPDNQVYIRADKHKLQRLVTTLIENGIKYNRSGGTVTIKVVPMDQWIELQVEDNGPGIPVQDLSKIFNRFYRCDTSRSEPGLGLGLSLAKAIAQAAGGDLTVESEIHQGSRFTVRLPL